MRINLFYKCTILFSLIFLSLFSWQSFSSFSVLDTGNLLQFRKFEISAHTQILIEKEDSYFNLITQFDESFFNRKDMNIRYLLGIGEYGLSGASFLKWIPFPDYQYQPAIGAIMGLSYRYNWGEDHFVGLHLRLLCSKELELSIGKWVPYIAVPVSIIIKNFKEVQYPIRWALGLRGEIPFIHFQKMEFNIEFSMDFKDLIGMKSATPISLIIGVATQFQ